MTSDIQKYDFNKPSGLRMESQLRAKAWFKNFSSLFKEKWSAAIQGDATAEFRSDAAGSFDFVRKSFPADAIAFEVLIPSAEIDSMLIFEYQHASYSACSMLGERPDESNENELTDIENTLFLIFINELVSTLTESWPFANEILLVLGDPIAQPHRSKMFSPKSLMIDLTFEYSEEEQQFAFHWLLPQRKFENFLFQVPAEKSNEKIDRINMEANLQQMTVELKVILGHLNLTLGQLSSLNTGDVIRLNQKIDEPVQVFVEDQLKFRAWPGAMGNWQSIQVSESA